jgi:hypothetical protein
MVRDLSNPLPEKISEFLDKHGIHTASSMQRQTCRDGLRFDSCCLELNDFLDGSLASGSLSEWGMLGGQGARELALSVVVQATQRRRLVLWVNGSETLDVYPPAWSARGVDLALVRFARVDRPVEVLKPVFLDRLFDLIVVDSPKHLGSDDWAFLARQARALDAHIMVLQDFLLSGKRGNIWARLRVNCTATTRGWRVSVVRGPAHDPCVIDRTSLFPG